MKHERRPGEGGVAISGLGRLPAARFCTPRAADAFDPRGSTIPGCNRETRVRNVTVYTTPRPERKPRDDAVDRIRQLLGVTDNQRDPQRCFATAEEIDPAVFVFASWVRVIEFAPIENKPVLFGMMARDAATWADAHRQQAVDDIWGVAAELGLVDLLGAASVQEILANAFRRSA